MAEPVGAKGGDPHQPRLKKLQHRIARLENQVRVLKRERRSETRERKQVAEQATADTSDQSDAAAAGTATSDKPTRRLTLGGSATLEYQKKSSHADDTIGGNAHFGRFVLNLNGQYDRWTFGLEQRFYNFDNGEIFHYGWGARRFGVDGDHKLQGGFYQVPFGNLRYGFYGFWGSLAHFAGYTNNQAAGAGYRLDDGPWRFDADFFKNDDADQEATYGVNPFAGYDRVNGLNLRAAYTLGASAGDHLTFSMAARGGQLAVGAQGAKGRRLATTLAANGRSGPWAFQAQIVDFRFDVPSGTRHNDRALPTDSVAVEHYGFKSYLPARGQLYGLNVARHLDVLGGDVVDLKLYDNAGYLHSGVGETNSNGNRLGDVAFNVAGLAIGRGPFHVWIEGLAGRNAGIAGLGPNDGDWHWRANVTFGLYFQGALNAGPQ